jgi:hypothetical protein
MHGTSITYVCDPSGFSIKISSYSRELFDFIVEQINGACLCIEADLKQEFPNHKKSWGYPSWSGGLSYDLYDHRSPEYAIKLWGAILEDGKNDIIDRIIKTNGCLDCPPVYCGQCYLPYSSKILTSVEETISNSVKNKLKEKLDNNGKKELKFVNAFNSTVI